MKVLDKKSEIKLLNHFNAEKEMFSIKHKFVCELLCTFET
jgi:hypothetical protein